MVEQLTADEPDTARAALTHRRVVVPVRGGPEVLTVVEEPMPTPAAGQVRLRTCAAGISGLDLMLRGGWFPGFPRAPFTPGVDVVGVVDRVGDGVTSLRLGQRVGALLGQDGGYAESVCVDADRAVPVPDGVDAAKAVCVVANYVTAHTMLHRVARVHPLQTVLVQGGAGGVGSALLELGRLVGLRTYATASPYNHDVVRSLGATPIDYHQGNVARRVRALTGGGVDVVFDPIGGARQLVGSYGALRAGGRLVWFGMAGASRHGTGVIPASLAMRGLLSLLPDGRSAPLPASIDEPIDEYRRTLALLLELLAAGRIDPIVAARFPLSDAAAAHGFLETQPHAGRAVLIASGDC